MKLLHFKLALCLLLGSAYCCFAQSVNFGSGTLRTGQTAYREMKLTIISDRELKYSGNLIGTAQIDWSLDFCRTETVLKADDGAATELKILFNKFRNREHFVFEGVAYDESDDARSHGRTYILNAGSPEITATYENGAAVPRVEKEFLQKQYRYFGETGKFLRNATVKTGQPLMVPLEVLREWLHESEPRIESYSVICKGTRVHEGVQAAVFSLNAKMLTIKSDVKLLVDLEGEALVGVKSCLPLKVSLAGTVKETGYDQLGSKLVMVTGKGTYNLSETFTYK